MSVGSATDSSALAWAEATIAAAESYQQEAHDRAWDERLDGVDDHKTASERAQDAFWGHDPNRPPTPPPSTGSSDGSNSSGGSTPETQAGGEDPGTGSTGTTPSGSSSSGSSTSSGSSSSGPTGPTQPVIVHGNPNAWTHITDPNVTSIVLTEIATPGAIRWIPGYGDFNTPPSEPPTPPPPQVPTAEPVAAPAEPTPVDNTRKLTAAEKAVVDKALKAERKVLENVLEALKRWDPQDQARFKEWFGEATPIARAHVQEVFTRMLQQNRTYSSDNVRFDPDATARASVDPQDPSTITVSQSFFDKNSQGELSQAATFIHERSHFESIVDAKDHTAAGDVTGTRNLAATDPRLALENAQSYAIYAAVTSAAAK